MASTLFKQQLLSTAFNGTCLQLRQHRPPLAVKPKPVKVTASVISTQPATLGRLPHSISAPQVDQPTLVSLISFSDDAQARMLAVVGRGQMSPWGVASWNAVLQQMSRKLTRRDPELQLLVLDDDCENPLLLRLMQSAQIIVAVNIQSAASAQRLMNAAAHIPTLVSFDSHAHLQSRLQGVPVCPPRNLLEALPVSSIHRASNKMRAVQEIWHRVTSDNILVALQLLINNYVKPVRSLQKLEGKGPAFVARALRSSGREILACLLDGEAREALMEMQECDPTDQFCTYRCIAQHENATLRALSLSLLEKGNCLELNAAIPMHLAVEPIQSFRGQVMTHELAENLLIGWSQKLGWSWKIAGNMFPIASQFKSQTQTFYRETPSTMWYDPVFQVMGKDGQAIWRRRHYSVYRAQQPGTFFFAFLDNGVMTREYWTIVDVAEDLSWALFHSLGAAPRTGQTFTGAVVCTPNGNWPSDTPTKMKYRLYRALEKCDIQDWETLQVDHSSYAGAPRLGPPEHVSTQVFLGEKSISNDHLSPNPHDLDTSF
ncbi:hypothetical protein L7F22_047563 [Adiantum nelumboides]|nr:hypothetical protein [Adiantum nelumboides]